MLLLTLHSAIASRIRSRQSASSSTSRIVIGSLAPPLLSVSLPVAVQHLSVPAVVVIGSLLIAATRPVPFPEPRRRPAAHISPEPRAAFSLLIFPMPLSPG